jgi:hypothetical protein
MATVAFTGTIYRGADGQQSLVLTAPGQYQVSEEKAMQLTTDFPREFALVVEQTPEKAPSDDATIKKVDTATQYKELTKKAS